MNLFIRTLTTIFVLLFLISCGGGGGGNGDSTIGNSDITGWDNINSGTSLNLNDVTFVNGIFVIAAGDMGGGQGTIMTSADGLTWNSQLLWNDASLYAIAHNNSQVVAISMGKLFTSSDLTDWTEITLLPPQFGNEFDDIAYGNDLFVVIGGRGDGLLYTSIDGLAWTDRGRISNGNEQFQSIAYGNGIYVAVGDSIAVSSNGITWNVAFSQIGTYLWKIAYGNGTFIAVGNNGVIRTSSDGLNWIVQNSGTNKALYGVDFGNNQFIAGGNGGTFLVSNDEGITWGIESSGNYNIRGMAYGNGFYIIVGNNGKILKSK